jgi:hypothetical protein
VNAFLADENFDGATLDGARRARPSLDILRVQDTELAGADDPTVLDFATRENRLLLTQDVRTLIGFATERLRRGIRTTAILELRRASPIKTIAFDLELIAECLAPGEWDNLLIFLPL